MTCDRCQQDPCACINSSSEGRPTRTWLLQTCQTPGCQVMIRSLPGEQDPEPLCKWCRSGIAYNADQIHGRKAPSPLLSLEEFGTDLFEAIKTQGAIAQAFKTAQRYRDRGKTRKAEETDASIVGLQLHLETLLAKGTIAPDDVRRLLAIA